MRSDILADLLSAAATLTSLNLVFLGFIVTAFQQNSATQEGMGPNRYRRLSVFSLAAFVIGIGCAGLCVVGLLLSAVPTGLFVVSIVIFFTQLSSLVALSVYAVLSMM